jgi:hypothetical protein
MGLAGSSAGMSKVSGLALWSRQPARSSIRKVAKIAYWWPFFKDIRSDVQLLEMKA